MINESNVQVLLLGAAQDGGFPQFGCKCSNCRLVYDKIIPSDSAVSLAIIDKITKQWWLVDATPQLNLQWEEFAHIFIDLQFCGVFITHAHIGHYPGIIYFGKEALNTKDLPLYASKQMNDFLLVNEPFSVMYRNGNIKHIILDDNDTIVLTDNVKIIAHKVDHRADFTDTFAFKIYGSKQNMFFCPDIDSWHNMYESLTLLAETMDILLIDSTFYDDNELPGRDMSTIPHPRVVDTISLLQSVTYKSIVFIHINHSNKLWSDHELISSLLEKRMIVGRKGMIWDI